MGLPDDARDTTPKMILQHALEVVEKQQPDKVLVIMLWDGFPSQDKYDTGFYNSGLSATEMVALLEIQKQIIIQREILKPPCMDGEEEDDEQELGDGNVQ